MGDVYTGIRGDWLFRQHVRLVRKKIRQAKKLEDTQFALKLQVEQKQQFTNLSAHLVKHKGRKRNGSNS
jgi:hypothetical protein